MFVSEFYYTKLKRKLKQSFYLIVINNIIHLISNTINFLLKPPCYNQSLKTTNITNIYQKLSLNHDNSTEYHPFKAYLLQIIVNVNSIEKRIRGFPTL